MTVPGGCIWKGFLAALVISFGVIFVAELGDKSQLMAMTFATRYKASTVLIGITVATAVVHLISVARRLRPRRRAADRVDRARRRRRVPRLRRLDPARRPVDRGGEDQGAAHRRIGPVAVAAAFFLAELGDKTMLATITLATQHGWFGTWIGSTVGMVAADALAILVGRLLGRHLPEKAIRYGAAALFVLFGVWLLVEAIAELTG